MSIAHSLQNLLESGIHQIGEIEIQTNVCNHRYLLSHIDDVDATRQPEFGALEVYQGPSAARELSTYSADGIYRFTKGQVNLKQGWVMLLHDENELRLALDHFYPAIIGLFIAQQNGTLEIEMLRDKLNRQSGMYKFARSISDAGAQQLVQKVCGPAHQCAKKILWQIDSETPLDNSEASRFNGIVGEIPELEAIPLLCREACNHFVAECRQAAKAEFAAKSSVE